MKRVIIPAAAGSLIPTVHEPFGDALEKLREAEHGILQMKAATDRVTYATGWTTFVDSLEEAWNRFFEEGKREEKRFMGWISKHKKVRNEDALLQYLTQARHQSQHGVAPLEWTAPSCFVGKDFNGILHNLKTFDDGTYEGDFRAFAGSSTPHPVSYDYGRPMLPVVHNRKFEQEFSPPKTHLGGDIRGIAPRDAATLALLFYSDLVAAAKQEFAQPGKKTT